MVTTTDRVSCNITILPILYILYILSILQYANKLMISFCRGGEAAEGNRAQT